MRVRERLHLLLVVALYGAMYLPAVGNGWLGLDDEVLVRRNTHLGHGLHSFVWSWLDVDFGRRWTPLLWTVADVVGKPTALRFHSLVFALGLIAVVLLYLEVKRQSASEWALLSVALFVVSPMRCEVFGWEMGFVYTSVAIWTLLAYRWRDRGWACCGCMCGALLTYPIAAGAALLAVWKHRGVLSGRFLLAFLATVAWTQLHLRHNIGFVPWAPRFDAVWLVLPHYALVAVWPFDNLPIFPAVFYPLLPLGLGLYAFCWLRAERATAVWTVLLLPVLLAAVTESFWLGGRYALLPDLWLCLCVAKAGTGLASAVVSRRLLVWLGAAMMVLAAVNVGERWMWYSARGIVRGVLQESYLVGREYYIDDRDHVMMVGPGGNR